MSITTIFKRAAALAAGLAVALPAAASVYVVRIDPPFGAPYPNLGWRATADLFVPDACLSSFSGFGPTSVPLISASPVCAGIAVTNTQVFFYDVADPGMTTVESFLLGSFANDASPASATTDQTQELLSIDFDGSGSYVQVTGLETSQSAYFTASSLLAPGGIFTLNLTTSGPSLTAVGSAASAPAGSNVTGTSVGRASIIPEPGSIALAFGAFAALGAARSLKRRR